MKFEYVSGATLLRRAAEDVVWAWDVQQAPDDIKRAIDALRQAVQAEKRMSWTDDYYDTKGEK